MTRWLTEEAVRAHQARVHGAPAKHSAASKPDPPASVLYPIVALCRLAGLPDPVPEFCFHPTRKWRFDYAWPQQQIALEIEGGLWTQGRHSRGAGAIADLAKYSEAAILGWRILYATPDEVKAGTALDRIVRAF